MNRGDRGAVIAAALIMAGFGLTAFLLPRIMIAVGDYSTVAGALVAILFVGAFFAIFWLRGRHRNRR